MSDKKQQHSAPVNSIPSKTGETQTPDRGNLPLSQAETIERLQGTIGQLEGIVAQLRTKSAENLPPQIAIETLVTSTQAIADFVKQEKSLTATPVEKVTEEAGREALPPQQKLDRSSREGIFGKIRVLLPTFIQEQLSNWKLIGIFAGVVLVLVITTVFLLPKPITEEGETSSQMESPPEKIEQLKQPSLPSQLEAPGFAQPVEIEPPPTLELTPEQSLIAAIQEQVAEITSQYAEGIIMSIKANFMDSRLLVTVGDNWYSLDGTQQKNLANEMLSRSQQLDFRKLEIQDTQGNLLARSPVVGQKMVILRSLRMPSAAGFTGLMN